MGNHISAYEVLKWFKNAVEKKNLILHEILNSFKMISGHIYVSFL